MVDRSMRTLLLLTLVAVAAVASRQAERPAQKLRSSVDLVGVDVTVLDGKGQPVLGLAQEDFTVVEAGRPLSIATVVPISGGASGAQPGRRESSGSGSMNNLFVVILDDLMLRFDAAALYRTKRVFREFVGRLSAGDDAAVLSTSGAPQHAVTFTSDKSKLVRAVDRLMPMSAQPAPDPSSTEPASGSLEPSELWKTRTSAALVRNAIQQLATIRESRKALVLISEGLPYDLLARGGIGAEVRRELMAMSEAGRAADIPVFAFDPGTWTIPLGYAQQNLRMLAEQTGGRLVPSTANLGASIDAMLEAQRNYYIVAFHPADNTRDSKHAFTVRVDRPGVTVRSRREYVVAPGTK